MSKSETDAENIKQHLKWVPEPELRRKASMRELSAQAAVGRTQTVPTMGGSISMPVTTPHSQNASLASSLNDRLQGRRIKEMATGSPLVPIGLLCTSGALVLGLRAMYRGDPVLQQRYMRYRVGAQFGTIVAMGISLAAAALYIGNERNEK